MENVDISKGFVDKPVPAGIDIVKEIKRLCKEKNAVIMGHFYQPAEIQDISDYIGDSLALAQLAQKTTADIILVCGVHFMGETAKILCPDKKVLVPDLNAGCSLADSCNPDDFKKFIDEHPGHKVVSYVNTTAKVKALTDICVTSSNAQKIIDQLPKDQKIIFGPDRNLGNYINSTSGRSMLLWDGACEVHEKFSLEKILALKKQYPGAPVLAHPECKKHVLVVADYVGSTKGIINYVNNSDKKTFIIATESGVIHEMRKQNPDKEFIPVPPDDSTCACNECAYMRLTTLEKVYNALKYEQPEILISEDVRKKAEKSIVTMLQMS
ncbi:MAG: quinolinate synthase NadA [Paludibacteraceae bacterium]|nr:quinolinate synthase NadA [Paludibacteraceae bacterium]